MEGKLKGSPFLKAPSVCTLAGGRYRTGAFARSILTERFFYTCTSVPVCSTGSEYSYKSYRRTCSGRAWIACWLERRVCDRKVASSNPDRERRENFLLRSQLCVLTLIRCPFHPCVAAVARKRLRSFCQKCRWQVTPKHAYTLDPTKSEWADYAAVQA